MAETPPQDALSREKHVPDVLVASRAAGLTKVEESSDSADDDAREIEQEGRIKPLKDGNDHRRDRQTEDVVQMISLAASWTTFPSLRPYSPSTIHPSGFFSIA